MQGLAWQFIAETVAIVSRTREVLCVQGRRIRELAAVVQKRAGFPDNFVVMFAERVENRASCAMAQCESLCGKLPGGLAVRRTCYGHDLQSARHQQGRYGGRVSPLARDGRRREGASAGLGALRRVRGTGRQTRIAQEESRGLHRGDRRCPEGGHQGGG